MPARIASELAQLARLARDGGLDLAQVSLRVKADLLLTSPHPPAADLAAFSEMAVALLPTVDDATAVILARKLAGWRYTPQPVLQAMMARGGPARVALLRHGMALPPADLEMLAEHGDPDALLALAERQDLTAQATLILADRADRAVDLALIANNAAPLPRATLDLLVARARGDGAYGPNLLARRDISAAELTPLFLQAGPERRAAMLDALSAIDALAPAERRQSLGSDVFTGWLTIAADDPIGAFGAIAAHLGGGAGLTSAAGLASALEQDRSRELTALALTASGSSVEDATRFLIRLGDETAHSVERIFALVALMRSVRPGVAQRIVMQVAGVYAPASPSRGQHQPVMDASGTPLRPGAAKPDSRSSVGDVMRRLGLRRDRA